MNMNDLQLALPSTSIIDPNTAFTFQTPYPQRFSIPYPIIKYIFHDPKSPNAWLKLIQTCKYLYSKNPIFPVVDLSIFGFKVNGRDIDLSSIAKNTWLCNSMRTIANVNVTSSIIQKVVKCDLRSLKVYAQNLNWNDYQKLTSSGTIKELYLHVYDSVLKNDNGTSVPFDMYLQNLDEIESISICNSNPSMFPEGTVKKMVEHLKKFKKLDYFRFNAIPENFDFASFKNFLMQNESVSIELQYRRRSSLDDAYKTMIRDTTKEIMNNPSLKYPFIYY